MKSNKVINWNYVSVLLSGSKNVIRSNFCPEQYKDVVRDLVSSVKDWYDLNDLEKGSVLVEQVIDSWESRLVRNVSKKIEPQVVVDIVPQVIGKKVVDMDALRAIASGNNLSGSFVKKKVNIDEEYDFELCKSIPSGDEAIYVDKQGLACYNRYDLGIYYVKWENRYLKFLDKKEFDRFSKEYLKF